MLKKLLKFGLELALKRYGSRMQRKPYGGYNSFGSKGYYKKRKKRKLFDLFD